MRLLQRSSIVDPYLLLTRRRLDIAVKTLYFRALKKQGETGRIPVFAVAAYVDHILQRTGGNEKRSPKNSVTDYLWAAGRLFASMRADGFDGAYPVELGSNLNLMGGAHRIACSMVLDLPVRRVVRDKPGMAAAWDEAFMRRRGMCDLAMVMILKEQERLEDEARRRSG